MIVFGSSVVEIADKNWVRRLMTLSVLIAGWFLVTLAVVVELVSGIILELSWRMGRFAWWQIVWRGWFCCEILSNFGEWWTTAKVCSVSTSAVFTCQGLIAGFVHSLMLCEPSNLTQREGSPQFFDSFRGLSTGPKRFISCTPKL